MADQIFTVRPATTTTEPTGAAPGTPSPTQQPAPTVPSVDRDAILQALAKARPAQKEEASVVIRDTLQSVGRDFVVEAKTQDRAAFYAKENALFEPYLLNNPEASRYAQGVLDKLTPHIPDVLRTRDNKTFRVVILDSDKITNEANGIDKGMARGTSSGTIYITTEMLKGLKSEAELAFVLSHELVHSLRNHSMRNSHEVAAGVTELQKRGISGEELSKAHAKNLQSREDEADMWGLQILDSAQYDVKHAAKLVEREMGHGHSHEGSEARGANRIRDIKVFTKVRGFDKNGGDMVGKDAYRDFLKSL